MDLVEVDNIDIQPAQTVLALATNGIRFQIAMDISLFVPAQTAFSENVRPRSRPGFQCKRDHFLGMAHSVNGGRIDPVNAKLECSMDRADRCFVVLIAPAKFPARAADGPCAKANGVMARSELPSRFVFILGFAFMFQFFVSKFRCRSCALSGDELMMRHVYA